jgi:hypothetical protein
MTTPHPFEGLSTQEVADVISSWMRTKTSEELVGISIAMRDVFDEISLRENPIDPELQRQSEADYHDLVERMDERRRIVTLRAEKARARVEAEMEALDLPSLDENVRKTSAFLLSLLERSLFCTLSWPRAKGVDTALPKVSREGDTLRFRLQHEYGSDENSAKGHSKLDVGIDICPDSVDISAEIWMSKRARSAEGERPWLDTQGSARNRTKLTMSDVIATIDTNGDDVLSMVHAYGLEKAYGKHSWLLMSDSAKSMATVLSAMGVKTNVIVP